MNPLQLSDYAAGVSRHVSHVQGLLTPFDRLEGFERRVHEPEPHAKASAPGTVEIMRVL